MIHAYDDIKLLIGWHKAAPFRGDDIWCNDSREVMIFTNNENSTLVKTNEIWLEFTSENHFFDAIRKSDEIFSTQYAKAH